MSPPPTNGRHSKSPCVTVCADINEARVAAEVVNAIGIGTGNRWTRKVMAIHFDRRLRRMPATAFVFAISNQFLLFRIHGNDGLSRFQCLRHGSIDVAKLGISIRMILAFFHLSVALQAVVRLMQQVRDRLVADTVPFCFEFTGQQSCALAGPSKRRFWITTRQRFDKRLQLPQQFWVTDRCFFSSRAGSTYSSGRNRAPVGNFVNALMNCLARQTTPTMNARYAPISQGHCFVGGSQTSSTLIQKAPNAFILFPNQSTRFHARILYTLMLACHVSILTVP